MIYNEGGGGRVGGRRRWSCELAEGEKSWNGVKERVKRRAVLPRLGRRDVEGSTRMSATVGR